jgi:ribosomal protein L40E
MADEPPALPSVAAATLPEDQDAPDHLTVDGRAVGQRVDPHEGEICLTCGEPISAQDVTYLVDGQRVPVHKGACLGVLAAAPTKWLAKLKPRGAFLDASAAKIGLSTGWLIFGSYVLLGLIFGALAAHRAFHVGRDPLTWLGIGLVANLPAFLVLLVLPKHEVHALGGVPGGLGKISATHSPDACPACGAENHPSARQCSSCGGTLQARFVAEVQKVGLRAD